MRIDVDYELALKEVFAHYGLKDQLSQLAEECNELAIASHHYARGSEEMQKFVLKEQLVGEIADVLNLINQITGALRIANDVSTVCKSKMEREVKRIQEGEKDKPGVTEQLEKLLAEIDKQTRPMIFYGPDQYVKVSYLTYLRNKLAEVIGK